MSRLFYAGAEVHLDGAPVVIGRHRSCGLQVRDDAASRQHARVRPDGDGGWWIDDLGSANGTQVNGRRVQGSQRLAGGDVIAIGTSTIEYRDGGTVQVPVGDDSSSHAALAGARFGGYLIEALLSVGTLGAVYRARNERHRRLEAIKVFAPAPLRADPGLGQRLVAEAGRLRGLEHRALPRLVDAGINDGMPWISLEWLAGEPLRGILDRGPLAPAAALDGAARLADGLLALHRLGMVHGDLRPATIIQERDGALRLADPGLGHLFAAPELPIAAPAEVAWYLGPEQVARGARDPRDDVYALGAVLMHMLLGRPPCTGEDASAVATAQRSGERPSLAAAGLPACLDALVQPMLALDPSWRPAGMAEVRAEIARARALLAGAPASVPRPAAPSAAPAAPAGVGERPAGRHRLPAVLAGLGLLAGSAGLLLLLWPTAPVLDSPPAAPPPPGPPPASPVPPPAPAPAPALPPPAAGEDASQRWRVAQERIDALAAAGRWVAAAEALEGAAASLARDAAGGALLPAVEARSQRLGEQAAGWYEERLAAMAEAAPGERLRRLDDLRAELPPALRPDAESRRQELLAAAAARLQEARLQARRALEEGRWGALPAIAAAAAAPLAGTPVAALQEELAARCAAAAAAGDLWRGTWALTLPGLRTAGTPAAEALLALAGERAAGARPPAARPVRSVLLAFDDPGDLRFIDILQGTPRLEGGALRGGSDEAVGLSCSVPLGGGGDWEARLRLRLGAGDGQVVVAVGAGGASALLVRIEAHRLALRCAAADGVREAVALRPAGDLPPLRLAQRAGTLEVELDGRGLLAVPQARIPADARLRLEAAGVAWALDDLELAGGGR